MPVKAIFWDNDGVLVETEHLYYAATRDVLAEVGIELTPGQYQELFLIQGRGAWHLALERGLPPVHVEQLRAKRHERYSQLIATPPQVIDGVAEVLGRLHGRYRMGCVTSSRRQHFDLIHQRTALLRYLDFVVTADDVAHTKPDPELYLRAIARANCKPDECVAIEDSARGLEAAVAAGLRCFVVPSSLTEGCDFSRAERVLRNVREVEDAIEAEMA